MQQVEPGLRQRHRMILLHAIFKMNNFTTLVCEDRRSFLLKTNFIIINMNKNVAILLIAFFYTCAMFLAQIAKQDAVQAAERGRRHSKSVSCYPWLIWILTTALSISAALC